eukprot:TRINITY_DN2519_c0_g2_i1.p1 TRINITY_DN2519_c0_g2~~TRINITY_DN2519_c0_g2_i1.p1  ORF type:complete len:172 (-),score=34.41 TRINITY_DN2519_c0_g2_i1:147-662(-)
MIRTLARAVLSANSVASTAKQVIPAVASRSLGGWNGGYNFVKGDHGRTRTSDLFDAVLERDLVQHRLSTLHFTPPVLSGPSTKDTDVANTIPLLPAEEETPSPLLELIAQRIAASHGEEGVPSGVDGDDMAGETAHELSSVLKKRRKKMNKHKLRKRRRLTRNIKREWRKA